MMTHDKEVGENRKQIYDLRSHCVSFHVIVIGNFPFISARVGIRCNLSFEYKKVTLLQEERIELRDNIISSDDVISASSISNAILLKQRQEQKSTTSGMT
jgi:hypothetical protein